MAKANILTGARALVSIDHKAVGIFNNITWSYGLTDAEVEILGAYGPVGLVYTGQNAVTAEASGYRVVDYGPHVVASVPHLFDLLTYDSVEIQIMDRQARPTDKAICTIRNVHPLGYSSGVAARQLSEVRVPFKGTRIDDESRINEEDPTAAQLIY